MHMRTFLHKIQCGYMNVEFNAHFGSVEKVKRSRKVMQKTFITAKSDKNIELILLLLFAEGFGV
jgi:hypothetical protein